MRGSDPRPLIGPDKQWVASQLALIAATVAAPWLERRRRDQQTARLRAARFAAGIGLLVAGGVVARQARRELAESFTMSPTPVRDGELVTTGIYAVVRHPMYLSVLLSLAGYAVLTASRLAALGTAVTAGFLHLKGEREERLLVERYPAYAAYRRQTAYRLLPGLL